MSQRKLRKGNKYARLTVIEDLPVEQCGVRRKAMVLCQCDCGTVKKLPVDRLFRDSNGKPKGDKSCGCLRLEKDPNTKRYHPRYGVWCGMKNRCYNPNVPGYEDWGGRGIIVEEPWFSSSQAFVDWYDTNCGGNYNLTLDRIDNDGNYSPDNCRLVTSKEQARNTRQVNWITAFGETLSFAEMVEKYGKAPYATIRNRVYEYGWDIETSFLTPPGGKPKRDLTPGQHLKITLNAARSRCNNPKDPAYHNYGGRGIRICEEWSVTGKETNHSAPALDRFRSWALANGWAPGLHLDRIDVNGDYSPANCRWITAAENSLNKRNNKIYTYKGDSDCAINLVAKYGSEGLTQELFRKRVSQGWTVEEALESPLR